MSKFSDHLESLEPLFDKAINDILKIEKKRNNMKATLIYEETSLIGWSQFTDVKHAEFKTNDPSTALDDAEAYLKTLKMHVLIHKGKYIHIDGMLFEITEKPAEPILAEVSTGIEL